MNLSLSGIIKISKVKCSMVNGDFIFFVFPFIFSRVYITIQITIKRTPTYQAIPHYAPNEMEILRKGNMEIGQHLFFALALNTIH